MWNGRIYSAASIFIVKLGGFLIFTTHGLASGKKLGGPIIPESGFWFAPSSEQKDLDVADYGCTLVTPAYVKRFVENILHQNIQHMAEADWWGHQDLYVIKKTAAR